MSDFISTEDDRLSGSNAVRISQLVGHLKKRTGTSAGLKFKRYNYEPIIERNKRRNTQSRVKTAIVRGQNDDTTDEVVIDTISDLNQVEKKTVLDYGFYDEKSGNTESRADL